MSHIRSHQPWPVTEDEIKQVDVRTKWPHEALDFTPWLAKNLHLLGDALEMKLEPVQMEVPVGPYFLDISGERWPTKA